jgi:hypothetical protein
LQLWTRKFHNFNSSKSPSLINLRRRLMSLFLTWTKPLTNFRRNQSTLTSMLLPAWSLKKWLK